MTKARIVARYTVSSANIADNVLSTVQLDISNFSNVKDYGAITDSTITVIDDMGNLYD